MNWLAILAGLAGLAQFAGALQSFGLLPAVGGSGAAFFVSDPVAGTIELAGAIVTLVLAYGLWQQQAWSQRAIVAITAVNIGIIFFTHFGGGASWWNAVPGIVLNAAILLYTRTSAVRQTVDP
jgi:uncharacterized membrane protein (DUF2068 family)